MFAAIATVRRSLGKFIGVEREYPVQSCRVCGSPIERERALRSIALRWTADYCSDRCAARMRQRRRRARRRGYLDASGPSENASQGL